MGEQQLTAEQIHESLSELIARVRDYDQHTSDDDVDRLCDAVETLRKQLTAMVDFSEHLNDELSKCRSRLIGYESYLEKPVRARCPSRGTLVSEHHPPPHTRYAVLRGNEIFTVTPCYGMHEPWWVAKTMAPDWPFEADPVAMESDDLWWPIAEFVEAAKAAGG